MHKCFLSEDPDGLAVEYNGISSHSAEYTAFHFQLFMG